MFTGLIESVGQVAEVSALERGFRLRLSTPLAGELSAGDSLAINGVCLTVVETSATDVRADVSPETARVTSLGALERGASVNLERPVRADSRLGGHFVQGHVDATGMIDSVSREGDCYRVAIQFPSSLAPYIVPKGSIAVDGISLTVAGLDDRRFEVQIVPYTWEHTNLQVRRAGDAVNLECDILGKYIVHAIERAGYSGVQQPAPVGPVRGS